MTDTAHTPHLTIDEAAALIGEDVATVTRHINNGRLPLQDDGLLERTDVERFGARLAEQRAALAELVRICEEAGLYAAQAEDYAAQDAELERLAAAGYGNLRMACRHIPVIVEGDLPDGRYFMLDVEHGTATLTAWANDARLVRHPETSGGHENNATLPHATITVAQDDVPLIRGEGIAHTVERLVAMLP